VEKILNKRKVRGKDKFLVQWKEFMREGVRKNCLKSKDPLKSLRDLSLGNSDDF